MKTVRILKAGDAGDAGKLMQELFQTVTGNDVIDITVRYRKKMNWKVDRKKIGGKTYTATFQPPESKQIHTFTVKMAQPERQLHRAAAFRVHLARKAK